MHTHISLLPTLVIIAQENDQLDLLNQLLLDGNTSNFCLRIIDVNNDDTNDLSVVSGDSVRVYAWFNKNYKLVLEGVYCHGNHPKILRSKTNGFNDLEISWVFRMMETKVVFKFNGKVYSEYSWEDEPF